MIPVNTVFAEFFDDPFFRTLSCPFIGSPQLTWNDGNSAKGVPNSRWDVVRKSRSPCCDVIERNSSAVPPCCPMVSGNLRHSLLAMPSCCPRSETNNTEKATVMANGNARNRLVPVPSCCSRSETNHMEKTVMSRTQVPKPVKTWVPLNCCPRATEGARRKNTVSQEDRSEPFTVYNPITSETRIFHKRRMEPLRTPNPSLSVLRDQDFFAQAIQCVPPVFRTTPSRSSKPIKRVQPMRRDKEPDSATKQTKEPQEPTEPGTQWSGFEPHLVSIIEQEVVERDTGVRWEDVAGQEDAKTALREAVVLPTKLPEVFRGARRPWKGVLLVGPPGTGKTLLARAAASECRSCTFFNVSSATLTSRYRGESEKLVRLLFAMAAEKAPSVIFIDEIDALCSDRSDDSEHEASRRFKSELLVQMDGLGTSAEKLVVVLAATNHPWDIDEAFRRRFERRIYVPLPDAEARRQLLRVKLRDVCLAVDVDEDAVAARLCGFSGSDVADVCREAAMAPLRRLLAVKGVDQLCALPPHDLQLPVTAADLDDAVRRCKRTVSKKHVRRLQDWVQKYAST